MGHSDEAPMSSQRSDAAQSATVDAAAEAPLTPLATTVTHDAQSGRKRIEVDLAQLRRHGLLAAPAEQRRLTDQYRTIKRPLLRNARPGAVATVPRGNLLMVASALASEGKTFTSVNLSLSIALEKDWTVLLVDGDCSKPQLTRLFSAEDEPGLIDLLRDPTLGLDAVVMDTNIPHLSFLPAGSRDPSAPELLASRRMSELCEELAKETGRMFLFDSSPLLLTTEAEVLATQVGQIAVVVRADKTPRQAVLDALAKLDAHKAIACILNQADRAEAELAYGAYQSYGE